MDNSTKDHASAIHVALFIFPKIMREMINNKWSPKDVIKRIEMDKGHIFMNKLSQEAKSMISNMKTNGYFALDICCLYQVIRYFSLLSSPKQGWGVDPKSDDKSKADDVERMKILRNNIIHCPQGGLSESERKKFFKQSIEIAERMDKRNHSPVNGFKSEIEKVQIDSVSIASQEIFENCPKYQGKLQITTDKRFVSLYYGNDIMMKIDAQNDQEDIKKKEVTVAIIKPDAVKAGKVDQILENIREAGIEILVQKEIRFTEGDIRQLYSHLQDQDLFKDLVQFMISDLSHVLVLTKGKTGENIIEEFKDLIGPSDIKEATTKKPNSLRAKYGQHTFMNALHGSKSSEIAERELAFLFPDFEVPSLESKTDILQTTLALLRPEAFRLHKEKFLTKIRDLGFKIAMQKKVFLTREKAEEFYKEHKGEEYFEQFVTNMTSDYVLALGLSRQNAIREWRNLLGPKEVSKAKNEASLSLRAQFAVHDTINSLHGSDSEETAKKELQFFFPLEETVAVIKPDAERHKDEIIDKIHEAGFKIADRKEITLSREIAEKLYAGHKHKDYYIDLIEHMTSGSTYFMVLSREDAVKGLRSLIGPTDPKLAKACLPDSIRAIYGESKLKNAVHGSSDPEHAAKTIKNIFGDRSSSCIIYLRDQNIDVNALLQKIDDIKESIRTRNYQIKDCIELTDIKLGSLILHVTIPHTCFRTMEILHKTLQSFFCQFFIAASIQRSSGNNFTVVLAESDLLFAEPTNRDDLDYLNEKPSPVLKLNVSVKDSAFQSELVLHREVSGFIAGLYNTVDRDNVPVNGSTREVLILADNEISRGSTPSSTNIQDSQRRTQQVAVTVVSETESNYFKISMLLFKISTRAVRIKFDDVFHPEHLRNTLRLNLSKLTYLKDKRCINQMQLNSMFPKTNDPSSQTFDTSLMICLLRNLAGIPITNKLPHRTELSVGADLSRIKAYRKDVSNSNDRTLTNEKFTAIWNEIEAAVIRLSGEKLTNDCGILKTKHFHVEDSQRIYTMIQAGKRVVQIEEINEDENRFEKQQSGKRQDFFNKKIEEWEEERKWFVQTNAFNFILQHLYERVLVVVGNPGMGKSMLLHQTALHLKITKGYTVFSCLDPEDIVSQFRKYTKQVFILDDACGQFTLVQSSIDRWKQYEISIAKVLESKQAIILASCRSQVFQEKQCQSLLIFSGCVCDLNASDCAITKQEKLNIANNCLSQNTIFEIESDLNSFYMFPLLCRLYKDREIKKAVSYFQNPFIFLKTELDSFNNEDGGLRCCSLFLCVIHGGCLNQAKLMDETESEFSQTLKTIFENFKINPGMSRKRVLDSLDTLLNIYLKEKDGQYSVLHDRLLDFLFYYFGQRYQQLIINFADSEMIRDRTLLQSLDTIPQEFTIVIDRQNETDYIQRLVKDMLSGYIDCVLYNHQMIHKDFRSKLVSHLQKLDDDDLTVTYVFSDIALDANEQTSQLLPLNFACRYGYKELSDFFLSKTKDINAYDGNNIPLIAACRKGDTYMTGLLLEKGAVVNQTDALGCSPLLWSCVYGNLNIIKMLLYKGAKVENIEVCSKSSPLIWACIGEFLYNCKSAHITEEFRGTSNVDEVISILVGNTNEHFFTQEHVIDVFLTVLRNGYLRGCIVAKEKYVQGTPPEFVSVVQNILRIIDKGFIEAYRDVGIQPNEINQTSPFIEIMNLFFDNGVDIDNSSVGGITPLSFACMVDMHKSQSVTYLLSKGASVNKYDVDGTYPLHIAMRLGKEGLVKSLIGNGAIVNFPDGISPIHWAINKQRVDIVDFLINAGAKINQRYKNGATFLHCAIRFGNDEIIKLLLKEGISVNCKDVLGKTPLMIAVNHGFLNVIRILISEGANVNARNSDWNSPLTLASMKGLTEIVRLLIANEADMYNSNKSGENSLILACLHNHLEVVKVLIDNGCNIESIEQKKKQTCLSVASCNGFANFVAYLIEHGAKVNTKNYKGTTPLMLATSKGHLNIVKMLIENKAEVNLQNDKGSTCLIKASSKGFNSILTYLIDKKASIDTANNSGETPLMLAIKNGHAPTVKILLKKGAKMDIKNKKGLSAFDFAQQANKSQISDLLSYFSQSIIKFYLPYLPLITMITFVIFLIWLYQTDE